MLCIPTCDALKLGLCLAILSGHMLASRTSPTGVSWVDGKYATTSPGLLVFQLAAKLAPALINLPCWFKPRPLGRKERPATSEAMLLYRARIGEGMYTPSQSLASSQRDVSLLLGFAVGLSKRAYAYIYPTFNVVSQFPVVGWIPLLTIFLGIDEALKIAAISLAVIVPVTLNTYKGIRNIPQSLIDVGRVYQFNVWQKFVRIVMPAALPNIFSGVRQGVMQAWLSLVFVELLSSSEGIGYLMVWGRQLLQMDIVFIGIIVIGVLGLLLDFVLRLLESRLQTWRQQAF